MCTYRHTVLQTCSRTNVLIHLLKIYYVYKINNIPVQHAVSIFVNNISSHRNAISKFISTSLRKGVGEFTYMSLGIMQ